MESTSEPDPASKTNPFTSHLVWAIMTKTATGKSEVIKVVRNHEEADQAVQDNPSMFYKSGPILLAWFSIKVLYFMKMLVLGYTVLMHHQGVGTFAPHFPSIDEAEEFSNAMRILTDGTAISEPIPVVASKNYIVNFDEASAIT